MLRFSSPLQGLFLGPWWNGWRDGRRGIPTPEQREPAAYEAELYHFTGECLHNLARRWEERDGKLHTDECSARARLTDTTAARRLAAEEQARRMADIAEAERASMAAAERERIPLPLYWLLQAGLGATEVPLNTVVFNLFGESRALTLLMAASLGFLIPICAHLSGSALRSGALGHKGRRVDRLLFVGQALILLGLLLGIAYVRATYLHDVAEEVVGIRLHPAAALATFAFFNTAFCGAGALLAYNHADPELRRAAATVHHTRAMYRASARSLARSIAAEQQAERARNTAEAQRLHEFQRARHEAHEWQCAVQRLVASYRKINLRSRGVPHRPASFIGTASVPLPDAFSGLRPCRHGEQCPVLPATAGNGTHSGNGAAHLRMVVPVRTGQE